MKYLLKSSDFITEKLFVEYINESMVYFSKPFRDILDKIEDTSGIVNDLKSILGQNIQNVDITLIHLDNPGYLSFAKMPSVKKNLETDALSFPGDLDNDFNQNYFDELFTNTKTWEKSRNQIKIGKLIQTFFPNKYNSAQIEEFTNKLKSLQSENSLKVEEVSGEDIKKWYNESSYQNLENSLGNSCMRYARCESYLDIYTKNPEVCKLVIITEGGKLVARALVWKVESEDFQWYMDRRYLNKEELDRTLKDYAIKKGWAYKTQNTFTNLTSVTFDGKVFNTEMTIKLKEGQDYSKFPYVDTFKTYYPEIFTLVNKEDTKSEKKAYLLNTTDGSYTDVKFITDSDEMVWSDWYDREIPIEVAIYSDRYGDWLLEDDAIYVEYGSTYNRGWYHTEDENLVYIDGYGYVHIDDTVWSSHYGEAILADDAVHIVDFISKEGDPGEEGTYLIPDDRDYIQRRRYSNTTWYKVLTAFYPDWMLYQGILYQLMAKDYKDNWIIKDFEVTTYMLTDEELYKYPRRIIFGLTQEDAQELNIQIDENQSRQEDLFEYYYYILVHVPELAADLEESVMKNGDFKEKHVFEIVKDYLEN
jgi:hypothetical protein